VGIERRWNRSRVEIESKLNPSRTTVESISNRNQIVVLTVALHALASLLIVQAKIVFCDLEPFLGDLNPQKTKASDIFGQN